MNVIITGSTGMVGEGVLHICLHDPRVEKVLAINRHSVGLTSPKLEEIIHSDFYNLNQVEEKLKGYDACFFCLGISSVGVSAEDYYETTYSLTMNVAETLVKKNPGMTFIYVSGQGTDGTEKGRLRWARVKGKTENDLRKMAFKKVYAYRPGFIKPIKGLRFSHKFYRYINWLFPVGKRLFPAGFSTMEELGKSMIEIVEHGSPHFVIDGKEISRLAKL